MRRSDIQAALEAALIVTNHHEFVVVGSLSVLGLLDTPPEAMSYSIDIDFYPLRDPGRASDIAAVLGENSDFHERNGYYLDAVSPALPVLPDGWQDRLVKVQLGQATVHFLDVHDTAVSKYARGAQNDYRWLEAGYESKILDIDVVAGRVRFSTTYFEAEDKRKTENGLLMHRVAMHKDGSMARKLLEYLQTNPPRQQIQELDQDRGRYRGPVLWADDNHAVQSLGRGDVAIHDVSAWQTKPAVASVMTVQFDSGTHKVNFEPPVRKRGVSPGR